MIGRAAMLARVVILLGCARALQAPVRTRAAVACRLAASSSSLDGFEGVEAAKVAVGEVGGVRGLVATSAIAKGETVVRCARASALETTDLEAKRAPRELRKAGYCDDAAWRAAGWEGRLALLLLHARAESPPLEAWIASLPESYADVPAYGWDAKQLEDCGYAPLRAAVAAQRAKNDAVVAALLGAGEARPYDAADLRWALATVTTRSFSGPVEGASPKARLATVGLAGWLAAGYALGGLGSPETAFQGFATVTLALVLSDFLVSRDDSINIERHVLAPGVDFLNHRSSAAADGAQAAYEYFGDAFSVAASRGYGAGDEVHASYGEKSNALLLANYGFVEVGNAFDDFVFPDAYPFPPLRGARVVAAGFDDAVAKAAVSYSGSQDAARENLAKACASQAAALEASGAAGALADLAAGHAALLRRLAKTTEASG